MCLIKSSVRKKVSGNKFEEISAWKHEPVTDYDIYRDFYLGHERQSIILNVLIKTEYCFSILWFNSQRYPLCRDNSNIINRNIDTLGYKSKGHFSAFIFVLPGLDTKF